MADKNLYIPMNELIKGMGGTWTFTNLDVPYTKIAELGIVLWCTENLEGKWTMLGGNKFGFEDAGDALSFKFKFGGTHD